MTSPSSSFVPGQPLWIELMATDLEKSKAFYGELFGWTFLSTGPDFGGYQIIHQAGADLGGAMQIDPETMPGTTDSWGLYLGTTDIDATTAAVPEQGGQVVVSPMAVADEGSMAFYLDPAGAAIGAWAPGKRLGLEVTGAPGTPCWFELMTHRYDEARSFYADVFGAEVSPMGEQGQPFQYSTIGTDGAPVAGICDASAFVGAEVPPYWRLYLATDDIDVSLDKLVALGGRVTDGPMDSPHGRLATVVDNQGAMFQLLMPSAATH